MQKQEQYDCMELFPDDDRGLGGLGGFLGPMAPQTKKNKIY